MGDRMKAEVNFDAASRNASAVEAAHWEPPVAPLDMPRQQLEREVAEPRLLSRLFGVMRQA